MLWCVSVQSEYVCQEGGDLQFGDRREQEWRKKNEKNESTKKEKKQ